MKKHLVAAKRRGHGHAPSKRSRKDVDLTCLKSLDFSG